MNINRALLLFLFPIILICFIRSHDRLTLQIKDFGRNLAHADAEGYYLYLPAIFIYGSFEDVPVNSTWQFSRVEATNRFYDKYTYGVAFMQLPFFAVADLVAKNSKIVRDGYSTPYMFSIFLATLFYCICGFILLFKSGLRPYKSGIRWLVLLGIFFGTNLMHYTFVESGMSHVYNFFMCACMIYYTPKFYSNVTWNSAIKMGFILGLMVFLRPTNIILGLYFLFFDISSLADINERGRLFLKHFVKVLVMTFPFLLFFGIQIGLWGHMLGEFVLYSYNNEPGFIHWMKPKIHWVWFSVWNGLFIYAPILIFSITGLIFGIFKKQKNQTLILTIFLISSYIFGSWWAWWFGGAYGARSFIDMLPLLCIPFAYLANQIVHSKSIILKILSGMFYYLTMFYSIRMTAKYKSPWDGEDWNWESWWEVVKSIF